MRHLEHKRIVRGSGDDDLRNLFAMSLLRKDENPLSCRRSSKYDASQENWTRTPESSYVSSGEVLMLHAREHRTDTGCDRRG